MADAEDLDRFLEAQASTYDRAIAELRAGRKLGHWMWWIFPQLAGLGRSATARRYGIASKAVAAAYLGHPVLGPRLIAAVEAALASGTRDPHALLGSPDDLKLHSCLTLFLAVSPGEPTLTRALDTFYEGVLDGLTLEHLAREMPQMP